MLGCPHDRPTVLDNALGQQQPALRTQKCASVDHEGRLSAGGCLSNFHFTTGGLRWSTTTYSVSSQSLKPTCLGSTASTGRRVLV